MAHVYKNGSHGVFISSSVINDHARDDLKKLCYQTTNINEFRGRGGAEERGENMEAVQNMGKKNSKYMPYQLKTVPNFGRESTYTSMEYFKKPLGDHLGNHMLAESFAGSKKRSASVGAIDGTTIYSEHYASRTQEDRQKAKPPSAAPNIHGTNTIGGTGSLMITRSFGHEMHQGRQATTKNNASLPVENLGLSGSPYSFLKSTYRREHNGEQRSRGNLSRTQ
mmetsp:Transcript_52893/g.113391  ORF Transcript_52893/g.113391 Transcript_52893/m.113391 type:complete len:223 (-) Transcript_52893:80-748(-)